MKRTRREFLTTSAGMVVLSRSGSASETPETDCNRNSNPTPEAPEDSLDVVISEAYGELGLCPQRPYWRWEVSSLDSFTLEYEVRATGEASPPDVLVVDQEGWNTYEQIITEYPVIDGPIVGSCTRNYPLVGQQDVPCVNGENINPGNILPKIGSFRDEQLWSSSSPGREAPIFEIDTVDCLSNPSPPIRESETIEGGHYYVVFDWTEDVLSEPDSEQVSAEVAIRATSPLDEVGEESGYQTEIESLYDSFPTDDAPLVQQTRILAEEICGSVEAIPVDEVQTAVPEVSQITSTLGILLTIFEDQLGYTPTFSQEVMAHASLWARLGMSVLPVVSSANQVIEDACDVADANPETVTEEVEDLLASLGILIADLFLVKVGAASRAARLATDMAHKYLLGFLRKVLGLRAYVVLLRELYTLLMSGISQALERIREVTRQLARETKFLDDEDVEWVEHQDEDSLSSLRPDFTLRSPECSP